MAANSVPSVMNMATLGWMSPAATRYSYRSRNRSNRYPRARCSIEPWLILQPSPGDTVCKLYSLAEKRVLSLKKRKDSDEMAPPDDALLVGSSHGWLALFDRKTQHVYLSNPISGRHIKLPPSPFHGPSRVILSCSPTDAGKCYAAMQSYPAPAFCVVGVSTDWTQLVHETYDASLLYNDFAFCPSRKLLSCITRSSFDFNSDGVAVAVLDNCTSADHQIDDWDIPRKVDSTWFWKFRGPPHIWKESEDVELLKKCCQKLHLVYAADYHPLPLIVVQFLYDKTVDFIVLQIEKDKDCIKVVDDLKGLAVFVGMNHSFAVPATGILKPNSVYFTPSTDYCAEFFISNDVGIFDYGNKTFSPCYFSRDINLDDNTKINFSHDIRLPFPMWFTPNPC